jgi:hypothetical protein
MLYQFQSVEWNTVKGSLGVGMILAVWVSADTIIWLIIWLSVFFIYFEISESMSLSSYRARKLNTQLCLEPLHFRAHFHTFSPQDLCHLHSLLSCHFTGGFPPKFCVISCFPQNFDKIPCFTLNTMLAHLFCIWELLGEGMVIVSDIFCSFSHSL